jgi:hypothetical protein
VIAGRAAGVKLIAFVAIVMVVLAWLAVLSAQRDKSPALPQLPLRSRNQNDGTIIPARAFSMQLTE